MEAGAIFAFSAASVNNARLMAKTSPILAAQQWLNAVNRCHKICTPMVVASAGCFAWLRYQTDNNLYLAVAVSCMSIVPYTVLLPSGPEKFFSLWPMQNRRMNTHLLWIILNERSGAGRLLMLSVSSSLLQVALCFWHLGCSEHR